MKNILIVDSGTVSGEIKKIKDELGNDAELRILHIFEGFEDLDFSTFDTIAVNSGFHGEVDIISLTEKILESKFEGSILIYSGSINSIFQSLPFK